MWRFLRNRDFPTNCGRDSVIGRKMSRGASREFGDFPTKLVARGRFVGIGGRFCAESTRFFRQNSLHGGVLSEWEPVGSLEVRCFSDKTGREGMLCRKELAVVCRELWGFPTKLVARGRFVGIGGRFCAGSSGVFRQNWLRSGVLSEYAVGFVPRTLGFSDKTGRAKAVCRNWRAVLR